MNLPDWITQSAERGFGEEEIDLYCREREREWHGGHLMILWDEDESEAILMYEDKHGHLFSAGFWEDIVSLADEVMERLEWDYVYPSGVLVPAVMIDGFPHPPVTIVND